MPSAKYGLVKIPVERRSKRLAVQVAPERSSYRPGEEVKVNVQVRDANGKPASAELAVFAVDEGRITLTRVLRIADGIQEPQLVLDPEFGQRVIGWQHASSGRHRSRWLDCELRANSCLAGPYSNDQLYVVGDHYTVADITGLVAIDFMKPAGLAVPEEFDNVRRWHGQVSARPSAKA